MRKLKPPGFSSNGETGPRGTRLIATLSFYGIKPYTRKKVWKSSWFNTGNQQRDFYLATLEMQKRVADAFEQGKIPGI